MANLAMSNPTARHSARTFFYLLAIAAVCFWPSVAFANSGSTLMLLTMLHLLFGNLLIGIGEGLLVAWVFKVGRTRVITLAILANYASMIAGLWGYYSIAEQIRNWIGPEAFFYHVAAVIAVLMAIGFLMSLAIEWVFYLIAVWKLPRRLLRSIQAVGLAQVASYAVMVPLYYYASLGNILQDTKLDPSLVPSAANTATIYYLSPDNWLCRIRINGTGMQRLLPVDQDLGRMYPTKGESGTWTLRADDKVLLKDFASDGVLAWPGRFNGEGDDVVGYPWHIFEPAAWASLKPPAKWQVTAGIYGSEGLMVTDLRTGQRYRIGLEIPPINWYVMNPSHLPNDTVVYQLGKQIVLYDLETRRLGFITEGRLPVVVLEKTPTTLPATLPATLPGASSLPASQPVKTDRATTSPIP